ncbi:MAG: LD-carboxypeptidase [Clostridium sp.]
MSLLRKGDTVGIVACSDGFNYDNKLVVDKLINQLNSFGLTVVCSDYIYIRESVFSGTSQEKALALMNFYKDHNIKAIFDISGGNLANGVLDYLDFDIIKNNYKPLFGYSDLTVLLNALYSKVGSKNYLYQVRNLVDNYKEIQCNNFKDTFMEEKKSLLDFDYEWIQGTTMEGVIIGGNIRCLLKLSGTQYMPNFNNKILLLESYSGGVGEMTTFLTQYKQQGAFKKVKGIILGHFTQMQKENYIPDIVEIVKDIVDDSTLPIVKTDYIGHGKDSKCAVIGENVKLKK